MDYWFKLQNRRAGILDFLGFSKDAIDLQRQLVTKAEAGSQRRSGLIERVNLNHNLSQYYGPSDAYLTDAIAACTELDGLAAGGEDPACRRVINRMIFDLRQDPGVIDDLAGIEARLAASGYEMDADYTDRDGIEIGIRAGEVEGLEERLVALLRKYRDRVNRRGEPTLYRCYGDLLSKLGRHHEAMLMYRQALALSTRYGWHNHLPRLMLKLADVHLMLGDLTAASNWLSKAEAHLTAHPEIPPYRVVEVHAARVSFLVHQGRVGKASTLRDAALADAAARGVPDFQLRALRELVVAADTPPPVAEPPPPATGIVDLQPRAVNSEVASGEPAYARFTLANPFGSPATGILRFPAPFAIQSWDDGAGILRVTAAAGDLGEAMSLQPIRIGPAELIRIYLEAGEADAARPGELSIEWQEPGRQPISSRWTFSGDDGTAGLTVVNASLVEWNPFYHVPLYHVIRLRERTPQVRDFRARSSIPCHVEFFDELHDVLLAVDHQGNGSFADAGDLLVEDGNDNLFPDRLFTVDHALLALELRLFPGAEVREVSAVTVALEGLVDGEWQALAENVIAIPETAP